MNTSHTITVTLELDLDVEITTEREPDDDGCGDSGDTENSMTGRRRGWHWVATDVHLEMTDPEIVRRVRRAFGKQVANEDQAVLDAVETIGCMDEPDHSNDHDD